ncbi:unannotated protein [freshwater metagenome]|uniref:Unannotated protein n=1 Tax=freshwater metagenome TaxID=449393 RepID=A0A6J6GKZ0_9ZZZZ
MSLHKLDHHRQQEHQVQVHSQLIQFPHLGLRLQVGLVKFRPRLHHLQHARCDFGGDRLRALMRSHHLLIYQKLHLLQLIFQQHQVLRKLKSLLLQHRKVLPLQQSCPLHVLLENPLGRAPQQFRLAPILWNPHQRELLLLTKQIIR